MKAVIMAGGEGTRLRPLTTRQPKPMLPLVNRPMMEHVVLLLREHGFTEIVVTVAFLASSIRNYFGDGSEFGVTMTYATEDLPLGTAGSVMNAMEELDETFLVISGDVLTDIDLSAVIETHRNRSATATIALKEVENPLEFGIVITNEDGFVTHFLEKPSWGQVFSDTVNTGIYVLEPEIFNYIPVGQQSDFSGDVFPRLLTDGKAIAGHISAGYWEDVGTLPAYLSAHFDALDSKVKLDIPGFRLQNGMWLGEGSELSPDAIVEGPGILGSFTTVGPGARLGGYTVLGSNVRIGDGADVERTVVHDNSFVGPNVRLRGNVLGRSSDLRTGARCEDGVVIGDETFVGEYAHIGDGVKIYPHKEVEPGAIVNSSIVWESRGSRNLFGSLGIAGLANVDITPELATRVAMAFASTLEKGTVISISRDSSRAARAVVRAIQAGLNTAGANVLDLEVAPIPITRFQVRSQRSRAGITVRLAFDDPESVVIRFFDEDGHDIDESTQRKIERLYHREDFRRVAASEIGDIGFPSRAIEYYTEALMASVDVEAIRTMKPKLVLDYAYGSPSFVMPNVLARLNAEVLAVNPFGSTRQMLRFDREEHMARVAALVQASGATLGAVFDPDGEQLSLVDDNGHVMSDESTRLAVLELVGHNVGDGPRKVVLPVSAPMGAIEICRRHNLEIVWSKVSTQHVTELASHGDVAFGGGQNGAFIFPGFIPASDAVCALVKINELMANAAVTLSEINATLPAVHIVRDTVTTPWEQKGQLMRSLVESLRGRNMELVDGVKVWEEDWWVLVLPDPTQPVTHVIAEASSGRDARAISQEYVSKIRQSVRQG